MDVIMEVVMEGKRPTRRKIFAMLGWVKCARLCAVLKRSSQINLVCEYKPYLDWDFFGLQGLGDWVLGSESARDQYLENY